MEVFPFGSIRWLLGLVRLAFGDDEIVNFDVFRRRHYLGDIATFPFAVPYLINKKYFI